MFTFLRRTSRKILFQFLQKISETADARVIGSSTLKGLLDWRPQLPMQACPLSPYAELGQSLRQTQTSQRSDIVMITARFRSGSTLLWNLFRHLDGITAYYEPFNERRWFDPISRGSRVDSTHKNVDVYWREYEGLDVLQTYYCEEWIRRNLYMDSTFWEPDMKRYVELLIEEAPGRPVLQFNRIDFRLPWFRQNFPQAKIIHLYRHPREQWCSFLMATERFPSTAMMGDFPPHDHFYLRLWAQDLKYHFPFLDEKCLTHPYQMFYYIWKLSYLFGLQYADYSLSFEHLIHESEKALPEMFSAVNIGHYPLDRLLPLIEHVPVNKWLAYANATWFSHHEALCETVLADFLAVGR